jgi:hypothetical protein
MKLSAATRLRLAARLRIKEKIGSSAGLAWNVAFNAVRISPNTPDTVTSTVTTPTTVAVAPDVGSLDRARMDLMKSLPVGPNNRPSSSLNGSASSPRERNRQHASRTTDCFDVRLTTYLLRAGLRLR